MGEASDHIREDIEETRERMGETVEAIGYKTDVKSRVKDNISDKKDAVVSRVTGAMPDGQQLKSGAQKVGVSKQNPLGLGLRPAAAVRRRRRPAGADRRRQADAGGDRHGRGRGPRALR